MSARMIIILIVLAIMTPFIISYAFYSLTQDTVTVTVTKSERVVKSSPNGDGGSNVSSKYLVFSEQEVLENTDCLWAWKWDSSDFYAKIKQDSTYTFKVYGWRVPFLSWHRNIVSIETVGK